MPPQHVTIEQIKQDLLTLAPFPEEIEAIGILGSLVQGSFCEYSDIDILIVGADNKFDGKAEKYWREKIYDVLSEYHRDKNIFFYTIQMLMKICTWYVFELASDSLLIYDRGKVKKIFDKIVEKATTEWDLVRTRYSRHWVWELGRPAKPGEILHFELTEEDVKF
ncbi:MAG: nucleotidyltransferase domain-containing protein [Elusimicrobiota bacterium]|nr:nucleotidyltransferase domain-containing protein [Elusimicrobiota bacterium]